MGTAQTWNGTYEDSPTEGSSPANGDNELRNIKTTIRGINNKEHWHGFETGLEDLNVVGVQGVHRAGSAIPFIQDTEPSARPNGTAFSYDYDRGRLWIDLSDNGKLKFLYYADDEAEPEWRPVISYSVGEIAAFAVIPPVSERWVACDGRTITKSDTSPDGTEGGYEGIIDALFEETGGDDEHQAPLAA